MSFDEMCRFCLRTELKMCPLFDTFNEFSSMRAAVIDLLKGAAKIEIFDGDGLPNQICKNCLDKFHQIYSFVLQCKRSDVILKQLKVPVVYLNRLRIIPSTEIYINPSYLVSESLPLVTYEKIECFETQENTSFDFQSYLINEKEYIVAADSNNEHEAIYNGSEEYLESAFEPDSLIEVDEAVGNELFKCPDCHIQCITLKLLQEHIMQNHLVDKLCKICDEEFKCSAIQHCCKHLPVDRDSKEAFVIKNNKKYFCLVCERTFQAKLRYEEHASLFIRQHSFECGICGTVFCTIVNLNDHIKQSHGIIVNQKKRNLDCSVCFEIFSSQCDLIKHMREGHIDKSQACGICFQSYPNAIVLANHMATSHAEMKTFNCEKCALFFTSRSGYIHHYQKMHGCAPLQCAQMVASPKGKFWKCEICLHCYVQESDLYKHLYFCHSEPTHTGYKCETCSKLFRYKRSLMAHEKSHKAVKPFQCAICLERFEEKDDLSDHARIVHPNNRSHKCEMCREVFLCRDRLRAHIRVKHVLLCCDESAPEICRSELNLNEYRKTHLGKVRYNCGNCDKTYSNKYALLEHIRVHHSGPKPNKHQCDQCPQSFLKHNNLQRHVRVFHTGVGIKCDICSKPFGSEQRKAIHMRTHTGERPIECKICFKSLRYESNLKDHMIVMHPELSDATGYKCEICSKICPTKSKLARHERIHKSEKPFQCDLCDVRHKHSGGIRIHKRLKHGIIEVKGSRLQIPETVEVPSEKEKKGANKTTSLEPIQCKFCPKTLQNKKILRTHVMVVHPESSNSIGHTCDICSKICGTKHKLKEHKRRHFSEKPFECDICGDRFKYRPNVRAHKRCKHGIIEPKGSLSRLRETVEPPPQNGQPTEMMENFVIDLPPNESMEMPITESQIELDLTDMMEISV